MLKYEEKNMNTKLYNRLNQLAENLNRREDCLGLLALGSCADIDRMDEWSDLDFFVIVDKDKQITYLNNLDWLESCAPLAYVFRNTKDGHKIMWEDGIYAEYAVFEYDQMNQIPFSKGQFIFKKMGYPLMDTPKMDYPELSQSIDYAINEVLTNLYVGLSRYHRGETLSAFRLIQVHAIDRILSMNRSSLHKDYDNFSLDRRVEFNHPELISFLKKSHLGYSSILESANVILEYIKTITELNPMMVHEIERLINLS